ncbi:MAG TPA: tetratricopeptide repeat protein [Hyphomonas sp.]|nr:tetratricopeptide repeat protein [Hyphomonas sp.]MCB9961114.1 tetratricopeptide repeat protein [Hyphomonas sp.]MCB9970405.1 tetratricopeptide repeat protein [Hyphomonas sp.]HPE47679.1 tetratricopeptide repeat protein [Hyphomonas sp.]
MSRAKTSLAVLALALTFVPACASAPDPKKEEQAKINAAVEDALKPATQEEIDAANNADPLTRANFWAKEHTKDPDNLDVALTFADSLRDIGSVDRAIEVLSQVMVVHPREPRLLMPLGRALAAKGNPQAAVAAFEQVTEIDPKSAEGWAALGTALDQADNSKAAQEAYVNALTLEPERATTLANYGLSLALSGDLKGAEEKLTKANSLAPNDIRIRENYALVLGLQGRFDDMKKVSGASAPDKVVEQNVDLLREMVQPVRSWDALSANAEVGRDPVQPTLEPGPAPDETPAAATSTPVEEEPMPMAGTESPAEAAGLRLRRSTDG